MKKEVKQGDWTILTGFTSFRVDFHREHPVVFLVNNKLYTQRRLTQLYIYLSLATDFGLPDHLQAFVLYTVLHVWTWENNKESLL